MGDTCSKGQKKLFVVPSKLRQPFPADEEVSSKQKGKLVLHERSKPRLTPSGAELPALHSSFRLALPAQDPAPLDSGRDSPVSPGKSHPARQPWLRAGPASEKQATARDGRRRPAASQESWTTLEQAQRPRFAVGQQRPVASFMSTQELTDVRSRTTAACTLGSLQNFGQARARPAGGLRQASGKAGQQPSPQDEEEPALSKHDTEEPDAPRGEAPGRQEAGLPAGKRLVCELRISPVRQRVSRPRAEKLPLVERHRLHQRADPARRRPSGAAVAAQDSQAVGPLSGLSPPKRVRLTVRGGPAEPRLPAGSSPRRPSSPTVRVTSMPQIHVSPKTDSQRVARFSHFRPPVPVQRGSRRGSDDRDPSLPPTPVFRPETRVRQNADPSALDHPADQSPPVAARLACHPRLAPKDSQSDHSDPMGDSFLYESFSQHIDPLLQLERICLPVSRDSG